MNEKQEKIMSNIVELCIIDAATSFISLVSRFINLSVDNQKFRGIKVNLDNYTYIIATGKDFTGEKRITRKTRKWWGADDWKNVDLPSEISEVLNNLSSRSEIVQQFKSLMTMKGFW